MIAPFYQAPEPVEFEALESPKNEGGHQGRLLPQGALIVLFAALWRRLVRGGRLIVERWRIIGQT
jgi:hypothetical protein